MLTAAQALDFRRPLRPGRGVEVAHRAVREHIAHAEADYEVGADIERCAGLLRGRDFIARVTTGAGALD